MKIESIVLDIDGTLLNSEKQITPKTKKLLIETQKKGIRLILASGRPTTGVLPLAKELEMDQHHGLIVSYNGAKVTDCSTGEEIYQKLMTVDESKRVLEHLKKFDVTVLIDHKDYMFCNDAYNRFVNWNGRQINIPEYESRGGNFKICEIDDLSAFCDFETAKITAAGDNTYINNHLKEIYGPFEGELNAMFTSTFYYEFTAKGVDKAKALAHVLEKIGISSNNLVAFGDGHNDISMVTYAGMGVAMENAEKELIEVADFVTKSNDEEGIVHFLHPRL